MSENTRPSVRQQIDENLRRVYQETLQEDVPDRFAELLKRLHAQEEGGPPSADTKEGAK